MANGKKGRAVHAAGDETTNETLSADQQAALEEARSFGSGRAQPTAEAAPAADDALSDDDDEEEDFEEIGSPRGPVHRTRAQDVAPTATHPMADTPWVETTNLVAPPPRAGYVQRWIRVGMWDKPDTKNQSRKLRQGWRPRPADTVPAEFYAPTVDKGQFAGAIIIEGMLLCEMPVELYERHRDVVRDKIDRMEEGIDRDLLRTQHPGVPISRHRKTRVTTGRRRPIVAPDA